MTPGFVDASLHVSPGSRAEFDEYLQRPWQTRSFPTTERHVYARTNEYWDRLETAGKAPSGPEVVAHDVFDEVGASQAVLLPFARGLLPSPNLSVALCTGTNDWLAARYLDDTRINVDGRFSGVIRVEPRDPDASVKEIERWAGHPHVVGVGVPAQTHSPYGHPSYLPVWRAAARHGLPIVVHTEPAAGVDFAPTAAGYPRFAAEVQVLEALNFSFHLASLYAEGVFRWVDDLVFVFADGGFDGLWPIVWRIDKDWKGNRAEVPAAEAPPSEILRDHIRFIAHKLEGPADPDEHSRWFAASTLADEIVMYGSNYPRWDAWTVREAEAALPESARERVLSENAVRTFGLATVASRA
jgi:predicted TIM-barrel fold metal-dependent hydrolase